MNITQQQLDCFIAIVKNNFHISKAALDLFQSQPGVTRHLHTLEEQMHTPLFIRDGRAIRALTPAGHELYTHALNLQEQWNRLRVRFNHLGQLDSGVLRIATTHTQAVYKLPKPLKDFRSDYPDISIEINQGSPLECVNFVLEDQADFAIATEEVSLCSDFWILPCFQWNRGFLVPRNHPLTQINKPTLNDVAQYPVLTYSIGLTGRSAMDKGFEAVGAKANTVLTAQDSEVIKVYVRAGFGVGIVASMIWNPERDLDLTMIDASHCFGWSTVWLGLPKNRKPSEATKAFVELFVQGVPKSEIEELWKKY